MLLGKRKESYIKLISRSMGSLSKVVTTSNIRLKDKNETVFHATKNFSIFQSYFSRLAQNLVSKLPLLPNIFHESKIASYYGNKAGDLNYQLLKTSLKIILSILKGFNLSKAASIDSLKGKFLKVII